MLRYWSRLVSTTVSPNPLFALPSSPAPGPSFTRHCTPGQILAKVVVHSEESLCCTRNSQMISKSTQARRTLLSEAAVERMMIAAAVGFSKRQERIRWGPAYDGGH